ncbi:MAG: metal-activated pyridoxal enzyme [Rhodothermaceae bacterium]|nr:MAG: metal-activated pyridoxal enzyme [Rhodothermaceae bacterium]
MTELPLLDDLPTPCLLVEQARLERNLTRMQALADAQNVRLRPHAKTHKSVALARRQVALGARGLTVAKPGEAEVFVDAGFDDIRLAYTVVGEDKHARLLRLMERARISFCVDTLDGARAASAFYAAHGRRAEVLVEVDVGYGRCGVRWDHPESIRFVREVATLPGLRLAGILTHAGHAYHGPRDGETAEDALRRVGVEERERMLAFAAALHEAGIPGVTPGAFELSIGSTPSLRFFENRTLAGFCITEVRPGNYVFHDVIQVGLGVAGLDACALTVLTTVISKHRDPDGQEHLFLDAGKKMFTSDQSQHADGYGVILYNARTMEPLPHARITALSEEHAWVRVPGGATLRVGDRVRVVPNHACVAVNTQPHLYLVDGERVLGTWPVDAQSRVW